MTQKFPVFRFWMPILAVFTIGLNACTDLFNRRDKQWAIEALQPVIDSLDGYYSLRQHYPLTLDEVIRTSSLTGIDVIHYGPTVQYTFSARGVTGTFGYTPQKPMIKSAPIHAYELVFGVGGQLPVQCTWTSLSEQWLCTE